MARLVENGAIISDNGEWAFTGRGWLAVVAQPKSKAPGMISGERRSAAKLMLSRMDKSLGAAAENYRVLTKAAEDLIKMVSEFGSVAAAENHMTEGAPNDIPPTILAPPVAPLEADVAQSPDLGETLRKLAALRDSGILTEGEFQRKKTELLARL